MLTLMSMSMVENVDEFFKWRNKDQNPNFCPNIHPNHLVSCPTFGFEFRYSIYEWIKENIRFVSVIGRKFVNIPETVQFKRIDLTTVYKLVCVQCFNELMQLFFNLTRILLCDFMPSFSLSFFIQWQFSMGLEFVTSLYKTEGKRIRCQNWVRRTPHFAEHHDSMQILETHGTHTETLYTSLNLNAAYAIVESIHFGLMVAFIYCRSFRKRKRITTTTFNSYWPLQMAIFQTANQWYVFVFLRSFWFGRCLYMQRFFLFHLIFLDFSSILNRWPDTF